MSKREKDKLSLRFLWSFPIMILIDIAVICFGIWLDIQVIPDPDPETLGHPAPIMTALFLVLMSFITMVVFFINLIRLVYVLIQRGKRRQAEQERGGTYYGGAADGYGQDVYGPQGYGPDGYGEVRDFIEQARSEADEMNTDKADGAQE